MAQVVAIREDRTNKDFTMRCPFTGELKIDQSVSHNGVCLTVVSIEGEHLIPCKEYVVCTKQFDALRVVRTTAEAGVVRLVAGDKKNFDELTISTSEIEQLYQVSAKLTIN